MDLFIGKGVKVKKEPQKLQKKGTKIKKKIVEKEKNNFKK